LASIALKISEKPQLIHDDAIAKKATIATAVFAERGTAARRAITR
jgi:hypothetical protein